MDWKKKDNKDQLIEKEVNGVPYLSFSALGETGMVVNGFSTRMGGVSAGKFATMNFAFNKGDCPEHVLENYSRMALALGVERDRMVVSYQTHTTGIRQVTLEDAGKGIIRERDYRDIDGLITDLPGITLVTFYADCVPLYLLDPVQKAIGLSHSGWRGTVNRMGKVTIDAMGSAFGTKAENLIVCIGPSICQDCFEVGAEVAEEFRLAFAKPHWEKLMKKKPDGKYQVDLWQSNRIVFEEAGVKPEKIYTTNICTQCNHTNLFSHRVLGSERGTLAAFLTLR